MLGLSDLLLAGVAPGLVALVVRQVALRARWGETIAWPLAIALGFTAGQIGLEAQGGATGLRDWLDKLPRAAMLVVSPRVASHWLPVGAAIGVVVAALAAAGRGPQRVAVAAGLALSLAIPARLLWGSVYFLSDWTRGEAIGKVALMGAGFALVAWLATRAGSDEQADRSPEGTLSAGLLAAVAFGLAIILATSGSLLYARLAGVLVAVLVGGTLGAVGLRKPPSLGEGVHSAGLVLTTLAGGLILLGFYYAEVTTPNACLMVLALASAGSARRGHLPRPWRAIALRSAICLVPLGVAAASAVVEFNRAIATAPENPYANWSAE